MVIETTGGLVRLDLGQGIRTNNTKARLERAVGCLLVPTCRIAIDTLLRGEAIQLPEAIAPFIISHFLAIGGYGCMLD